MLTIFSQVKKVYENLSFISNCTIKLFKKSLYAFLLQFKTLSKNNFKSRVMDLKPLIKKTFGSKEWHWKGSAMNKNNILSTV
jgi:hypothetical protein